MYYRRSFPTRDSAKHAVVEFIEAYYNRRRPHTALGGQHPGAVVLLGPQRAAGGPAGPGGVIQSGASTRGPSQPRLSLARAQSGPTKRATLKGW